MITNVSCTYVLDKEFFMDTSETKVRVTIEKQKYTIMKQGIFQTTKYIKIFIPQL